MSDEIPADLIELKRQFRAIERELAELSATMPTPTAVAAGEAEEDPTSRERWSTLHARLGETVMQIHRHPAFEALAMPERLKLDQAASKAARES